MIECAVLIAGAGVAGSATACHLARRGWSVVLVDPLHNLRAGGETILPNAKPEIESLGWTAELTNIAKPVFATQVAWGDVHFELPSILNPGGEALSVDRTELANLARSAMNSTGARLYLSTRIISVSGEAGNWIADCDHLRVRSRFLVDATGRGAWLGRRLGAEWIDFDRMIAIVATFPVETDPILYVESTPDGWFYSVGTRKSLTVAFLTDADLFPSPRADISRHFVEALSVAPLMRQRVGNQRATAVLTRPAQCGFLHPSHSEGWMAIGDASEAWDPLSGSGVFQALTTARVAAERLDRWLKGLGDDRPVVNHFQEHMNIRRKHYSRETRWSSRPFWTRRSDLDGQREIRINPDQMLKADDGLPTVALRAESVIPPSLIRQISLFCRTPRRAVELAAMLRNHRTYPGDHLAVMAIQSLVEQGVPVANLELNENMELAILLPFGCQCRSRSRRYSGCDFQIPSGPPIGESRPTTPARCLAAVREAPEVGASRPISLGLVVPSVG